MPSPFPGMNPYLEQHGVWNDFHKTFLVTMRELLTPQLVPRYVGRLEEHVHTHNVDDGRTSAFQDEIHSVYLEIRDTAGLEVVTTIELLSPSNKRTGPDREAYRARVRRVLSSSANFVEIDLLRGGPRMPWGNLPACDYYALVSRPETRPRTDVWPVALRDRLPSIPIPVRAGEPAA
ncbi:hypothetical protein ETAA1_47170 [Urbifossiella limnaea]|uniref:DUF4058 family protein n=1 Tax=Urbifossiella limnaea TaxID=2528023 RepID=A0A517XZ09_9BACT|nr:hypothetical protein ETAA1_47170 [Urbifossiella limnaea]